jgi:hypothetical protein
MKILIDFNANVGRENTSKPTIRNESSWEIINDNGIRVENLPHQKVNSTMFLHLNFHEQIYNSPYGKTYPVLIDTRWHSNKVDVRSFRWADYDTDHWLVVTKVKTDRRQVIKKRRSMIRIDLIASSWRCESFTLKSQTELQLWKNFDDDDDINRAWENIIQTIWASATESLGYHKLKQHKPFKSDLNYHIKGRMLNCNDCRIQVKQIEIIWTM